MTTTANSDEVTITMTRAEWYGAVMALNGAQNMLHGAGTYGAAADCASDLHQLAVVLGRGV
jgi:hypothetical protein